MHVSQKAKPVTVTLPYDLIHKVKTVARAEDRSFSNALARLVRSAVLQVEQNESQELATSRG
jgi:hypothetical protein